MPSSDSLDAVGVVSSDVLLVDMVETSLGGWAAHPTKTIADKPSAHFLVISMSLFSARFLVAAQHAIKPYKMALSTVEMLAIDGRITTRIIEHFTRKKIPVLTVHDSYVIQSQYEQELMDQMVYATKAEIGDFYFKKKQEKLSPNVITTFAKMDSQINVIQSYKSITESINRTEGYKLRYERFTRYLNDYHPEGWRTER